MEEQWREVVGRETTHEVSTLGRVRSIDRTTLVTRTCKKSGKTATWSVFYKGKLLRPSVRSFITGYLCVEVAGKTCAVHRMVLEAFEGAAPEGMVALHANDDKADNRLSNLSWGTQSKNTQDAIKSGISPIGERHYRAELKNDNVSEIRKLLTTMSDTVIAALYGVSPGAVQSIRSGRSWKHVL